MKDRFDTGGVRNRAESRIRDHPTGIDAPRRASVVCRFEITLFARGVGCGDPKADAYEDRYWRKSDVSLEIRRKCNVRESSA